MIRGTLIWGAVVSTIAVPVLAAAFSPLLQWRDPVYILAGFSGIVGLAILLVQPLLIARTLPCISAPRVHFWVGMGLVFAVIVHVAGLWVTSPPDVVDVLLFRSPTPFSIWGAVAMWAIFGAALLAVFKIRLMPSLWRLGHSAAIILAVLGTVIHAWLVQGAMETFTKAVLCLCVVSASVWTLRKRRVWRLLRRTRAQ